MGVFPEAAVFFSESWYGAPRLFKKFSLRRDVVQHPTPGRQCCLHLK